MILCALLSSKTISSIFKNVNNFHETLASALSALTRLGSRKGIWPVKNLNGEMLAWLCLGQGADLRMAQLMPLPLTISCSSKSRLVLPFWCRLTRVVPDKIQEGRKMDVCVCVSPVIHNDTRLDSWVK